MCNFFSFLSDGEGNYYYIDFQVRQEQLTGKNRRIPGGFLKQMLPDSHDAIATFHNKNEDYLNKYEFNPITRDFVTDQQNTYNDRAEAKAWVEKLDFSKVVPHFINKPFVLPFLGASRTPTEYDLKLFGKCIKIYKELTQKNKSDFEKIEKILIRTMTKQVGVDFENLIQLLDEKYDSFGNSDKYNLAETAYISSFFDVDPGIDIRPFVNLWNRGMVFGIKFQDNWDGRGDPQDYQLVSGGHRTIVYHRKVD